MSREETRLLDTPMDSFEEVPRSSLNESIFSTAERIGSRLDGLLGVERAVLFGIRFREGGVIFSTNVLESFIDFTNQENI